METIIKQFLEISTQSQILSIAGFVVAIVTAFALVITLKQTNKITKCETYQRLELASIDLFKFEIERSVNTWKLYNDKPVVHLGNVYFDIV